MKIVSVVFDYGLSKNYETLAKVFAYSVRKNCPDAHLEIIRTKPPEINRKLPSKSFASNTLKIDIWLDVLNRTDEDVIFMDCDMLVLKDLSQAFESNFDIGYTKRTAKRIPYNGGVVFVKNTPEAKEFIQLWNQINRKMFDNYKFHAPWRSKYAGMNQASFGYILEQEEFSAKLRQFPCAEWNSCVEDWRDITTDTRVIHIKGALRRTVLNQGAYLRDSLFRRAVQLWNNYAVEAGVRIGNKSFHNIQEFAPEKNRHPHQRRRRAGLRRRRRPRIMGR